VVTELKYAVRSIFQARAVSSLAMLTLGLGIGASATIVSVVNGVLLEPLPYEDAERLVTIFQRSPGAKVEEDFLSPGQFFDILEQSSAFEELSMVTGGPILLNREGPAIHTGFLWVGSSFLRMIGARPYLGRLLTAEDDASDAPFVVVLSYELWQRRYGGDPNIVGSTIGTETGETKVVGVLEPGFLLDTETFTNPWYTGTFEVVLNMPLTERRRNDRDNEGYGIVGKLKPDVTEAEAQAELDVIAARMLEERPPLIADASFVLDAVPLLERIVGRTREVLWMLLGAAGGLALIACANVSNLLLARAESRRREIGICSAMGAGTRRVVLRLLAESAALGGGGAAVGLGLAWLSLAVLKRLGPVGVPRLDNVELDLFVLAVAAMISIAASMMAGVVPALRATTMNLKDVIGSAAIHTGALPKRIDSASSFVVLQVVLAFVLLIAVGLISRSFAKLLDVDPGFEPSKTLTLRVQQRRDTERPPEALFERIRGIPGVRAVAIGTPLPFAPGAWWAPIEVEDDNSTPDAPSAIVDRRSVSAKYFDALEIPLLDGRLFEEHDFLPGAAPVRVVDRNFAVTFWPRGSAVGKRVSQRDEPWATPDAPLATIVGVVGHVRHYGLESDGRMTMYLPEHQLERTYLVVRTDGDPERLIHPVTAAIRELDPEIAISNVRTMEGRIADELAPNRLALALVHGFGWVALVLALVGLYGLMVSRVAKSTREIGMRMALGATASVINRMMLGRGGRLLAIGVSVGAALALVSSRLLSSFLFAVEPVDLLTYTVVGAVLVIFGLFACWVPARIAGRLDVVEALRTQ
jgi:predicted permease